MNPGSRGRSPHRKAGFAVVMAGYLPAATELLQVRDECCLVPDNLLHTQDDLSFA
jgi:hypothetical protein